jgi:hypothetical protein
MSFVIYDLTFLVLFTLGVVWFLVAKRKKLGREGPIFLYRTQIGVRIMDNISKKASWLLKPLGYVIVGTGYVLMAIMIYFLFQLVGIFARPEYVQLIKVPPLIPLIPYLPSIFKIEWLPPLYFTYWIIIIAVVAIVHEGAHGIYSRLHGIKVKSTGFGFLGPILTFFVEPDEKKSRKAKTSKQLSILGAGVFANILTAILFFFILWLFFSLTYVPMGALFNTYSFDKVNVEELDDFKILEGRLAVDGLNTTQIELDGKSYYIWDGHLEELGGYEEGSVNLYHDYDAIRQGLRGAITEIEGIEIKSQESISLALENREVGEIIEVKTLYENEVLEYEIELSGDYNDPDRAVIGIGVLEPDTRGIRGFFYKALNSFRDPTVEYAPKDGSQLIEFVYFLIWWMILVNIGVALFNILPIGITDGGRYWYLTMLAITKSENFARRSYKFITYFILLIFVLLMILWGIGIR